MHFQTSRVRSDRTVLVHGLLHAGTMFAELMDGDGWRFRYYPDSGLANLTAMARELSAADVVYQIGGRTTMGKFLGAARLLRKQKIVMHWAGSDVLDERNALVRAKSDAWVLEKVSHWAVSEWIQEEARGIGVDCQLVPIPSAHIPDCPPPLPEEFAVLVYLPAVSRAHLYGLDRILEVARDLPEIRFELVGLVEGQIDDRPANLRIHGRIPNLAAFYRRASVVWRPVRHDGLSCMVMEGLGYGRHVLWSYAFPGCVQVTSALNARDEIARLYGLHQQNKMPLNSAGRQALADGGYLPRQARLSILARLEKILES
jgi:hypothetical protein